MTLRRTLSLAFLAVGALPMLAVALYLSLAQLDIQQHNIRMHSNTLARDGAHALDNLLQNAVRDVRAFAVTGVSAAAAPGEIRRRLLAYTYAYPYFATLLWVGAAGEVIAATDASMEARRLAEVFPDVEDQYRTLETAAAGAVQISDYDDVSPAERAALEAGARKPFVLTLQLMSRIDAGPRTAGGSIVAVMTNQAVTLAVEDLERRTQGALRVDLLNARGDVIVSSDPAAQLLKPHPLAAEIAARLEAGGDGVQFEALVGGEAASVTVHETDGVGAPRAAVWRLVLVQSRQAVRAPIERVVRQGMLIVAPLLAAAVLVGLWLARRTLRPIETLAAVAARLGKGERAARVGDIARGGEIGALATAFDAMAEAIERDHAEIERSHFDLEAREREARESNEMLSVLQIAGSMMEAGELIGRFAPRVLGSDMPGVLYLMRASHNALERIAGWGDLPSPEVIVPDDCWGLRRGDAYGADPAGSGLVCAHVVRAAHRREYLCVPLIAQGESQGLLHVACGGAVQPTDREQRRDTALRLAAQLALALANVRLREVLREQSIRDPLTGLHNRRYLEESLEREIARAQREQRPIAVFMLDVDHFKRFNDTWGHEAGDAVLRALGRVMKEAARAGDLACRFGGEEFTAVLPGAACEPARAWAERLMHRVRSMSVKAAGQTLPPVTISMGLACYPENGDDIETLLQAADLALYAAKHAGRDRLAVAGEPAAAAA